MLRLRELRKAKKNSQQEIANFLGITQATFSGWENEKYEIDTESLVKLADYFNCTVDYLLGVDEKQPAAESGDEQLEECVVLHRDGKTQTYKFSQKQLDLIADMIEQLGGEKIDL